MALKQNKTEGKSTENEGKKGETGGERRENKRERGENRGEGGEGELLELSMDTWLTVCKEDELPQDLSGLSLEECEVLVPNGPGGWRKVSAILHCLLREARAGRDEAERIRSEAFCIKRAAELDCQKVRLDAKHLVQRGDMDAQQVKEQTERRICEIKELAESRFKDLRNDSLHKHNEHDILLGKLQAVLERQGKCLQDSEKIFEDHEEEIREITEFTEKKFSEFESAVIEVEERIGRLKTINQEINLDFDQKIKSLRSEFRTEIADNRTRQVLLSLSCVVGLISILLYIILSTPGVIFEETNSRFVSHDNKLEELKGRIEMKIATLEIDTASGFKHSQKKLSSIDQNLEQRLESFISNFKNEVKLLQDRLEVVEDELEDQEDKVENIKEGTEINLNNLRSELQEELNQASQRFDEFMKPKILLTKTVSKEDRRRVQEGVFLGLYEETGRVANRPIFSMINGNYKLYSKVENQWFVSTLNNSQEEEIYLQYNPQIPSISTDRWKYPSHKTSLVHYLPCCRNILLNQVVFALTDGIQCGRGVWRSVEDQNLVFHESGIWKVVINGSEFMSEVSSICPADINKEQSFVNNESNKVDIKCL